MSGSPDLTRLSTTRAAASLLFIQVLRRLAEFGRDHDCREAPVVMAGDMNATSFRKLRGIANAAALLNAVGAGEGEERGGRPHPFAFDCKEINTGKTSFTSSRSVRIDAVLYQSQRLRLIDAVKTPTLESPIPNASHPSDHIPIKATFELRTELDFYQECARAWYKAVSGAESPFPLGDEQAPAHV